MNMYVHELKAYRNQTIVWIFMLCGLVMIFMGFYPVLQKDMQTFLKLIDHLPPFIQAIIGFAMKDFVTPLGFYCFIFTYSSLIAAIQAANLGVGIISKEIRERTVDFLVTKPVSRIKIVTVKLLSVWTILTLTNAIYTIVSAITLNAYAEEAINWRVFFLINLSLYLLQIIFFSIGLALSFSMKKIKSILPISLGMVFFFFAISAFAVTSKEDKLRYLTPFQYFKSEDILQTGLYETGFTIFGLMVAVLCIAVSYVLYIRKDMPTV